MKPQTKRVLSALKRRSLTPMEALSHIGTDSLAQRVWEIRKDFGHASVERRWEYTRDGRRFARYFWRGEAA
jgi:hypothetical protein